MERSLRLYVKKALEKLGELQAKGTGGGGVLGTLIKVAGVFGSILSGNPLPALITGAAAGTSFGPGTIEAGAVNPLPAGLAKPTLSGGAIQVTIDTRGLMEGAIVMADDPEVMDRVARKVIVPALQRVADENI